MNNYNSNQRESLPTEPDDVLAHTWHLIQTGIKDRHHNYHTTFLSYIANNTPVSAALVPRKLDTTQYILQCHTDSRSSKIMHLQKNKAACLLFWCRQQKTQIRLQGAVTIQHKNPLTETIWEQVKPMSRACYAADIAPNTKTDSPTSGFTESQWDNRQTQCNTPFAYAHFAILQVHIEQIERLDLRVTGHQKIQFVRHKSAQDEITWRHQWLAP